MDRDDFFDGLRSDSSELDEVIRRQRQLSYEERVIKRAVTTSGVKLSGWGRLANHCRSTTGRDKLNFDWFNKHMSFPFYLSGRRLPGLHELTFQDMFKPSKSNRLLKIIARGLNKVGIGDDFDVAFAFVFPVVRTSFCAFPNCENTSMKTGERVQWVMRGGEENLPDLVVEPANSFFRSINPDWFAFPES